jgi:gluconate 5-dehydrogenase
MSKARTVQQLHNLSGRTALITGGSRGLGLQMAHALGEAGASLVISARKADELAHAEEQLRSAGITVSSVVADGSDEAQVIALAEAAMARLGGTVDILVNNAGTTWGAPAAEHPTDAWDKVMNLNVRGVFLLSREIARRSMIPRGWGRIVNLSSIAALGGSLEMQAVAYHASKGAVATLTKALACEWGPHGITVNAILPGVFPSRMAKHLVAGESGQRIAAALPLRRLGDDEGLKGAVLLFASDAGKHITGQLLPVDGGASAVVG